MHEIDPMIARVPTQFIRRKHTLETTAMRMFRASLLDGEVGRQPLPDGSRLKQEEPLATQFA